MFTPSKTMKCGCTFGAGRRVAYSDLRAHFEHIKKSIEEAATQLLFLELIVAINRDPDVHVPLSKTRFSLMDALGTYEEAALPALNKKFPEDKLAEALGL